MFERTKDPENRERLVQVIRNDVKRIDRLITDISDASRLDAELSRGHSEPIDLSKLLDTIVDIYTGMDVPRGIRIRFAENSDKSVFVQGIGTRLGQVFRNLIDNAISFSPDGGTVMVGAKAMNSHVQATVEDEGPGISEDDLERVFQRFYTERPAEQGFGKNSGLGLAIARQIVASHGGRIWAENKYNTDGKRSGARFIVELPLIRTET
jgi:two-component system sensor histidine kinase ChvG